MGSDWSWSLSLPQGYLTPEVVEDVVTLAGAAGFGLPRPDGGFDAFGTQTGSVAHQLVERAEVIAGLADGTYATKLWTASEVDVFLNIQPGAEEEPDSFLLTLDSAHIWRRPEPEADPFRRLHRALTGAWLSIAENHGASFGRVDHGWSLEQIETFAPLFRVPLPLGWWTYLDATYTQELPPLPDGIEGIDVTVTPSGDGSTVISLSDDPADTEPEAYADFHLRLMGL